MISYHWYPGTLVFKLDCHHRPPEPCCAVQSKLALLLCGAVQHKLTAVLCQRTVQSNSLALFPCGAVHQRLIAAWCHSDFIYVDLLFRLVCDLQTPMPCSNYQSKRLALLLCGIVHQKLTYILGDFTYEDLLFRQVCDHQAPMPCSNYPSKTFALISLWCFAQAHSGLVSRLSHL